MSIKDFIARFKLNNKQRRIETSLINFPEALQTPRQVLICLPGELRELTMVKQFLPQLSTLFKPATINLLSPPGMKVADILPRKGFNILAPTSDQQTWSGLAKKSYLQTLLDLKFDIILDLNLTASPFVSSILLSFPDAIRIGRGNHLGQPFYNLEIKTRYLRDERNIYRALVETLQLLKDGGRLKQPINGNGK